MFFEAFPSKFIHKGSPVWPHMYIVQYFLKIQSDASQEGAYTVLLDSKRNKIFKQTTKIKGN